jgi:DNA-binding NtrC family response regulator
MEPEQHAGGAGTAPGARIPPSRLRLLVLHQDRPRLQALTAALAAEGYAVTGAGCGAEAQRAIDTLGPPDALLVPAACAGPTPAMAFARQCLERYPRLVVLYLLALPRPPAMPLLCREILLPLPFTADALADALARALAATAAALPLGR